MSVSRFGSPSGDTVKLPTPAISARVPARSRRLTVTVIAPGSNVVVSERGMMGRPGPAAVTGVRNAIPLPATVIRWSIASASRRRSVSSGRKSPMFGGGVAAAGIATRKLMFPASSLRIVKNVMSNPAPASRPGPGG